MLKVNARHFVEAAGYLTFLEDLGQTLQEQGFRGLSGDDFIPVKERISALRRECEALGLVLTIAQIDRVLGRGGLYPEELKSFMREISNRFADELDAIAFYSLRTDQAVFFEKPLERWHKVIDRFGCGFDVEEARKCFGLERYTAAVFHLMKVVEAAVLELQVFLKDRDVKAHFGSVLSKLEDMTQKQRHEHVPVELRPYLQFMKDVLTQLHAIKDSWRNKVSHVDALIVPVDTFTEELAKGVYDATLLLMTKLTDGLPPAVRS